MDLREKIIAKREALGWNQAELGRRSGAGQQNVQRYEAGGVKNSKYVPAILDALGLSATGDELTGNAGQGNYKQPPRLLGEADLPVFAAVEGGPGVMVVTTEPIEFVARPLALKHVPDSYAVLVVGDSMEPAYEQGDMVLVHPKRPAVKGKNAIFVSGENEGEFRATVKRLLSDAGDSWKVRQFNPPQDFTLSKAEWPKALRIIGKFDGA